MRAQLPPYLLTFRGGPFDGARVASEGVSSEYAYRTAEDPSILAVYTATGRRPGSTSEWIYQFVGFEPAGDQPVGR